MFSSLGEKLVCRARAYALTKDAKKAIVGALHKHIQSIVGKIVQVGDIIYEPKTGVLSVCVANRAVGNEIMFLQDKIIRAAAVEKILISRVRVSV